MKLEKIVVIVLFLIVGNVFSQDITVNLNRRKFDKPYQLKLGVNPGLLSNITYKSDIIDENGGGFNYGIALTYSYYFNDFLGFETGVGFSPYSTELTLKGNSFATYAKDNDKPEELFIFHLNMKDYRDNVNIDFMEIPIRMVYDLGRRSDDKLGYYASFGAKIAIPIEQKSTVLADLVESKGEYPSYNTDKFEGMKNHGFGKWVGYEEESGLNNIGLTITASVEGGVNYKVTNANMVYVGVYADYAFLNLKSDTNDKGTPLEYNPTGKPFSNGGLTSFKGVDKVRFYSCGLQVKFSLF